MSDTNSPTPGTPQTATKALVATILTAVTVFVSAWLADDNGASASEVFNWALSALVSAGIVGYPTLLGVTGVNEDTGHPDLQLTITKPPNELVNKKIVKLRVENGASR
jgi:hypothetical protein